MQRWKILPIPFDDVDAYRDAIRLNSLGSLFFFIHHTLGRDRLSTLHWQMCQALETEDLHAVFEIPMSHFKSTCGAEGLAMWWALPFTSKDEYMMRQLGYGDEWIAWMKLAHNQNTRTLITHEVEALAIKLGKKVDEHYQNNALFRFVFADILPDGFCTWNDHSKYQKRVHGAADSGQGEGTFEYRGVGQSLQSMHFDGIINDDSVGREAQQNMLRGDGAVMENIYRWWKQTTTRFDSASFTKTGIGRQLIIGNRWGHADLNSMIRANHKEFKIESHSAEGGCCTAHPLGKPIFPEEYSMERLQHERQTLGPYDYAHFMLNQSVMPEECIFKPEWLKYFRFKQSRPDLSLDDPRNQLMVEHEVTNGTVNVIPVGALHRRMIVDLAHAKKKRRCDHVILVIGYDPESDKIYVLECWAEPSSYSDLVANIYKIGHRWGMRDMWLETVAAQNLLKFYLEERNMKEQKPLFVNELPYDNSENAKKNRIELIEPIMKNGQLYVHRSQTKLIGQVSAYPAGLIDILDTMGYAPQTLGGVRTRGASDWLSQQQQDFANRQSGAGGY
jgi:hypothetical protein